MLHEKIPGKNTQFIENKTIKLNRKRAVKINRITFY